jgi:hypothetical protein
VSKQKRDSKSSAQGQGNELGEPTFRPESVAYVEGVTRPRSIVREFGMCGQSVWQLPGSSSIGRVINFFLRISSYHEFRNHSTLALDLKHIDGNR